MRAREAHKGRHEMREASSREKERDLVERGNLGGVMRRYL
jgi:hypothetical protein